jgi:hypothetical protein
MATRRKRDFPRIRVEKRAIADAQQLRSVWENDEGQLLAIAECL